MTTMGIKLTENEYKQLEADVASGDKVYINDLFNQPFLKKLQLSNRRCQKQRRSNTPISCKLSQKDALYMDVLLVGLAGKF